MFNLLPYEILQLIKKFIENDININIINKRTTILIDSIVYPNKNNNEFSIKELIEYMTKYEKQITKLNIPDDIFYELINKYALKNIISIKSNIQKLNIILPAYIISYEKYHSEIFCSLQILNLSNSKIHTIDFLKNCVQLHTLVLQNCNQLIDISEIESFKLLANLNINGCINLITLDSLYCLRSLIKLEFVLLGKNHLNIRYDLLILQNNNLRFILTNDMHLEMYHITYFNTICNKLNLLHNKNVRCIKLLDISKTKLTKDMQSLLIGISATSIINLNIRNTCLSDIQFLRTFSKLQVLDISYNNISDISYIQENRELKKFYCEWTHIKNLKGITQCNKLRVLNISMNIYLTSNSILKFISECTIKLVNLNLSCNTITNTILQKLTDNFKSLKELNLSGCKGNDIINTPLILFNQLKSNNYRELIKLDLNFTYTNTVDNILLNCPNLQYLNLACCFIKYIDAFYMSSCVVKLKHLNLSSSMISNIDSLFYGSSANSLEFLDISYTPLESKLCMYINDSCNYLHQTYNRIDNLNESNIVQYNNHTYMQVMQNINMHSTSRTCNNMKIHRYIFAKLPNLKMLNTNQFNNSH